MAEYDGEGNLTTYTSGPRIDEIVAKRDVSGNKFYFIRDGLKSVRMILDQEGNVIEKIDYDAFGEMKKTEEKIVRADTQLMTHSSRPPKTVEAGPTRSPASSSTLSKTSRGGSGESRLGDSRLATTFSRFRLRYSWMISFSPCIFSIFSRQYLIRA